MARVEPYINGIRKSALVMELSSVEYLLLLALSGLVLYLLSFDLAGHNTYSVILIAIILSMKQYYSKLIVSIALFMNNF
jgi:hypothetical protein